MRRSLAVLLLTACGAQVGDGDGVVDEPPGPGWTAEIECSAHDVGGTAVVLEDDILEIRGFTYDGGGLNARIFLVVDGATFSRELELTDNLVGTGPYEGETLVLDIPAEAEPGTWDALTLWCIPAAVSFGMGVFQPPE